MLGLRALLGKPTPSLATLMVAVAAMFFSLVPWFAKNLAEAGIASPSISAFRFGLAALVLSPYLRFSRAKRATTFWAMAAGLGLGLGWIGYVEALKTATVATVGVMYMTYPLFTLAFAWMWRRETPATQSIGAGVLILMAAIVSLSPSMARPGAVAGLLWALSAPLSFGFAITVLTEKLYKLAPMERTAGVSLGAVIGLLPLIATLPSAAVLPSTSADWALVAGISIVTFLTPAFLYSIAAPAIGPARTAMAGSVELPVMFVVGWLAFSESIGPTQAFAGALVVVAVLITPSSPARNEVMESDAGSRNTSW